MPEQTHKKGIKKRAAFTGLAPVNPLFKFEKKCLFCGQLNDSVTYTCTCNPEKWFYEYRILDLKAVYAQNYRQKIIQSFKRYSFDHKTGIIQYKGLPFRRWYPEQLQPVGMTPLYHLKKLSKSCNSNIYIKNEGENPSGCFKDRETLLALLNTMRRGLRHAVIYSSGNAAASAAIFAEQLNLQLITFVAGDTYPEKTKFIRAHGSDVVVVGDESTNFEEGFRLFAEINAKEIFAKNGFDNWSVRNPYRVQGDKTTAVEIVKQLASSVFPVAEVPDWVIIPTGNGSELAGIWKGFKELKALGIISKLPKMVSAGMANASPVYQAVVKNQTARPERCNLDKVAHEDLSIGSTILAEEGYDSMEAAKAVLNSGGMAIEVTTADVKNTLKDFLEIEGDLALQNAILPEPASLVSISAIQDIPLKPSDTAVCLITGHGMKAKEIIDQLLLDHPQLQNLVGQIIQKKKTSITHASHKTGRQKNVNANVEAVVKAFRKLKT